MSDCEELVGGFKGYVAEMLVGTLISGRSTSGVINEAEFINLYTPRIDITLYCDLRINLS